ncbi:inter-alpha-trypsin inhibitor heavy chain H5 isoform X2 [Electrophorus electricus]|uniref:inter-alpha-trypsin inhibitor heavy chain H5 isoform X2 n=2 Tax=Electrophorus electricus TaxID=8005 RepID=UPI0015CFAF52|nr:inter-alpha-trypsin inhibitor heavy chain H5 isoform X2 [Electrophorus electricus]
MLLVACVLCFSQVACALTANEDATEDVDLEDGMVSQLDLGNAPRRVPRQVKTLLSKETKPHIQELSIQTTIMSRYAFTAVSCTMLNRYSAATEGVFQLQVPAAAFISNFTMIVGGRVFPSQIKVKKKNGDKNRDENNGRMKSKKSAERSEGEAETFRMAITVPGRNRAVFLLTYEELLVRRLGYYEHVTSVRPMHLVSRLNVGVTIVEHSRIKYLDVLPLRNGKTSPSSGTARRTATMPVSTVVRQNETFCKISFTPNIVQQVKITNNGILGDFVVRYDVEREMGIGDIQVLDGHFVHYFAPKDLPIVPKNVVFVIDTSASMVGTKIRQTKEALFTILRDLRPNDRFNFVTFSSRIRVWQPGKLVPVTPNNVRDAKKFIYMISPTGGTDINRGIQAGSLLLSEYLSSQEHTNGNSVSLIIFLTDGRPTVGVIQTPSILGNTKTAVKEKFCIFTIGMGKDVDYRLLERMALENCGTMRRIPEEADTSTMLKGFYDEIGTPLLSDIRMEYSDDAVEYVTRNHFPNYFNGSEIVVAGRLHNRSANALHVQVTASNSEHSLTMETDVSLGERERQTRRRVKEAEAEAGVGADGYVERLWGFLSVKEGLKGRLRSHGGAERENFTRRAADLSLAYNFLTPLTQMLVETPQVLADGTVARAEPAGGPPPDDSGMANRLLEWEESAGDTPQSLHRKKKEELHQSSVVGTGTNGIKKPTKKSVTFSKTSADGDPHFVVEFPHNKLNVCFNINGEAGDILRLVTDHKHSGVTVNGKLIGTPAPSGSHKQQRTYFGSITVVVDMPRRSYIEVTPHKVILDSRDRMVLPCSSSISVESESLSVNIAANASVTVTIQASIQFVILLHGYKNPAPYQQDHLGFYIANKKGLSKDTHGLLGQFLYEEVALIQLHGNITVATGNDMGGAGPAPGNAEPEHTGLKVKKRTVEVVKKTRRIYSGTHTVDCWFAKNNAAHLIDGQYQDYVVPHQFDTGHWPHGNNMH